MRIDREYPREVKLREGSTRVDWMKPSDRDRLLALARAIPEHDLLFMHRDLTRDDAVHSWMLELERGELVSLMAEREGALLGYASVQPERDPWSRHVAELRVLVSPEQRGRGLGQALTQEAFAVALSAGIEKIVARMTPDQKSAIRTFQGLGFRPEALLQEHLRDGDGQKHDLLILSHDVARFHARLEAYGIAEALGE